MILYPTIMSKFIFPGGRSAYKFSKLRKWLPLFVAVGMAFPLVTKGEETVVQRGQIYLWSAEPCVNGLGLCSLPKALGVSWPVEITYLRPTAVGRHLVADQLFSSGVWSVHLTQTWVEVVPPEVSYLVTQVVLARTNQGLVSLCSRYDATNAFAFLPPGACAARDGDRIVGVTLSR